VTPFVVVVVVLVALGAVGATVVLGLRWADRHLSRTRHQQSTVHALQLALFALVEASRQRFDAATLNGQWPARARVEGSWASAYAQARPTVVRQLALVEDPELKELTSRLLESSGQLLATSDPATAARLWREVEGAHDRLRLRTVEVTRSLNLRRLR
jgi:hypothetical protein